MSQKENDASRELARMNDDLEKIIGNRTTSNQPGRKKRSTPRARLRKQRKKLSKPMMALLIITLLLGCGIAAGSILLLMGKNQMLKELPIADVEIAAPEGATLLDGGDTVEYDGRIWHRNKSVTSVLLLGIDRKEEQTGSKEIGENGQADTIVVAALDTRAGNMTLLNISRDSMAEVDLYNINGEYAGTETMQIALSHAYGDGGASSCRNTAKSVSRLLYGMPVNAYASIDVPALPVLNDLVGGVEVDVKEDLSDKDPALKAGAHVLLEGEQVETYVISRDFYDTEANNARMLRQQQYMTGFFQKARARIRRSPTFVYTLYRTMDPYLETDLTAPRVAYLAYCALRGVFNEQNVVSVAGEVSRGKDRYGEEHAEFHVDEEALYRQILEIYYIPE